MHSHNVMVAESRRIKGVWKCDMERSQGGRGGGARFWGERSVLEKVRQDVTQDPQLLLPQSLASADTALQ